MYGAGRADEGKGAGEMESTTSLPPAFIAERQRQIASEGYDSLHDDEHVNGELLAVARLYYQRAIGQTLQMRDVRFDQGEVALVDRVPVGFPWDPGYWKPKTPQRDLERAGALCLAEIERRRRAGAVDGDRSIDVVEEQLEAIVSAYKALPA